MSFIKTFSGKHFYYDRINKDDIVINDIAVSLSNICRFAGHLSHFYSVAQHAVWICPYISRHLLSLNPLLACCRRYSRGER